MDISFAEGSFYKGTLEEGSIVKFFDPNNNGIYSRVEKIFRIKK